MFFENRLSTTPMPGSIIGAKSKSYAMGDGMLVDYEDGGIAINDTSEGLQYQVWKCYVVNQRDVYIKAQTTGDIHFLFTQESLQEVSLTFDANMHPCIAYEAADICRLYWYDSLIQAFKITYFGPTYTSMKVLLDEKRIAMSTYSDIICTYIRSYGDDNSGLYMRRQRDRFAIQYLLYDGLVGPIYQFGMGKNWRLQWVL